MKTKKFSQYLKRQSLAILGGGCALGLTTLLTSITGARASEPGRDCELCLMLRVADHSPLAPTQFELARQGLEITQMFSPEMRKAGPPLHYEPWPVVEFNSDYTPALQPSYVQNAMNSVLSPLNGSASSAAGFGGSVAAAQSGGGSVWNFSSSLGPWGAGSDAWSGFSHQDWMKYTEPYLQN